MHANIASPIISCPDKYLALTFRDPSIKMVSFPFANSEDGSNRYDFGAAENSLVSEEALPKFLLEHQRSRIS